MAWTKHGRLSLRESSLGEHSFAERKETILAATRQSPVQRLTEPDADAWRLLPLIASPARNRLIPRHLGSSGRAATEQL
jgi:hypothetical protein